MPTKSAGFEAKVRTSSTKSPKLPPKVRTSSTKSADFAERCKAELEEAAKQPLAPLTANVAYAVRVMLTVAGNVEKYMPALKQLGIDDADKLAMRANALSYAQALHDWTLNAPQKVEVFAAEVVNARRLLTTELDLMVVRGKIADGAVKLQTTGSYPDMAQDVRAIVPSIYDARPKKKNEKPTDAPVETVTPPVAPPPPVNGPFGAAITSMRGPMTRPEIRKARAG